MTLSKYLILFLFLGGLSAQAQISRTKRIDDGGTGPYPAIAATEASLSDYVVYRPEDLQAAAAMAGPLPIMVWANGGCMNSSINHERLLTEVASHGYVVVAIGTLQMTQEERKHEPTPDTALLTGLDWILAQAAERGSDYYGSVDTSQIAAGGQSCGGAQVMRIAGEERIKTYLMFNSGMGDMTMAGASTRSLTNLDRSVLYLEGGETDVAYQNALLDYDRIDGVPVAFANNLDAGHGGTFAEANGGSFARMTLDWLDWQLKGTDRSAVFLNSDLAAYPGWTMKSKGFGTPGGRSSAPHDFTPPELGFVCELRVTIGTPVDLGETPRGRRVIIPITGGTFEGPRLKGTVLEGGADYQYVQLGGTRTELDAIYTIRTDDGVLIHVRNAGLIHTAGAGAETYFRAAPSFEAPLDSDYAWLNNALFVCKPVGREDHISIQVWRVD